MPFFIFVAALAGAMLPLQGSLNARLGRALGSSFWAAGVSAALTAILLGTAGFLITRSLPKTDDLSTLPPWAWLGGVCGFFIMAGITLAAPRLGAAGMVAFVVAGQVVFSMIIDRFGLFGMTAQPISYQRLLAAGLFLGGAVLIRG
jgi:transporter family-2 protein